MEPTSKSPEINKLLDSISPAPRVESIKRNTCTWCKKPAMAFRDELSMKEYRISGMCQKCQDQVWGEEG